MSRTIESRTALKAAMLATLVVATTLPAGAQTLADLAQAQRVKQTAEIAKLHREAAAAELELSVPLKPIEPPKPTEEEARRATRRAAEAARPRVVLHALYARNGTWVAELVEGQRVAMALVGMQLYGQRIVAIDQRGVMVTKPCTALDVRDKARCGNRVVAVGESI